MLVKPLGKLCQGYVKVLKFTGRLRVGLEQFTQLRACYDNSLVLERGLIMSLLMIFLTSLRACAGLIVMHKNV